MLLSINPLNVTPESVNMIKDLRNYKWEQDKITGKFLNILIDAFNHALDALRYGCMTKLGRRRFSMRQEN
jgi:phage terminase large subunit